MILDTLFAASLPLAILLGIVCLVQQVLIRNLRKEVARNQAIRTGWVLDELLRAEQIRTVDSAHIRPLIDLRAVDQIGAGATGPSLSDP